MFVVVYANFLQFSEIFVNQRLGLSNTNINTNHKSLLAVHGCMHYVVAQVPPFMNSLAFICTCKMSSIYFYLFELSTCD